VAISAGERRKRNSTSFRSVRLALLRVRIRRFIRGGNRGKKVSQPREVGIWIELGIREKGEKREDHQVDWLGYRREERET